jgi:hypothetical protein
MRISLGSEDLETELLAGNKLASPIRSTHPLSNDGNRIQRPTRDDGEFSATEKVPRMRRRVHTAAAYTLLPGESALMTVEYTPVPWSYGSGRKTEYLFTATATGPLNSIVTATMDKLVACANDSEATQKHECIGHIEEAGADDPTPISWAKAADICCAGRLEHLAQE